MSDSPVRTLEIQWQDPVAAMASARGLSGMEALQAIVEGRLPPPPIAVLLGYGLSHVEHGLAVFEGLPGEQHYNPIGVVHGGLAATLLDSAMACAVHTTLPAGVGYTTLELKVNYLRPMTVDTGRVRCTGKLIHAGKRVATAEGRLEDEKGRLLSHGTTTCLILEPL